MAVELKGGKNLRATNVIQQVQNGLDIASELLGNQPVEDWLPLVLFSGRLSSEDVRQLRLNHVSFRNERKQILTRRCGTRLSEVLAR